MLAQIVLLCKMVDGRYLGLDGNHLVMIVLVVVLVMHVLGSPMHHHGLLLALDASPPCGICSHVTKRMDIVKRTAISMWFTKSTL